MRIYVVALLFLAGCALTPEQERVQFEAEVNHMRDTYGEGCKVFGEERSDAWVRCVMESHYWAQAQRAAAARAFGEAIRNYGNTVYGPEATRLQQIPIQPIPAYQPRQLNCQTFGNQTSCTQY